MKTRRKWKHGFLPDFGRIVIAGIVRLFVKNCSFIYLILHVALFVSFVRPESYEYNSHLNSQMEHIPCKELFRNRLQKQIPCFCSKNIDNTTTINCDRVAFFGAFPLLPFRSTITVFTQRNSGIQNLESQLFTASDIRLRKVDFSKNLLRRLMERVFDGIEDTLIELNLNDNLLGDQLNPIFATNEFLSLRALRALHLANNAFRALDSNLFKGLGNLTLLNLEGNELTTIPYESISTLKSLQVLNLGSNYIEEFITIFPNLLYLKVLNLTNNRLSTIKSQTFASLTSLEELYLSYNKLRDLSAHSVHGLNNVQLLDLTNNFFEFVPIEALSYLLNLRKLLLGSNCIQNLDENMFNALNLPLLEYLDLSRNQLVTLNGANTFAGIANLKHLNLAFNSLRKVDETDEKLFAMFSKLETLDFTDNHLIQFPNSLFFALQSVKKTLLDYNKIEAVTEDMLKHLSDCEELSLAFNLIQELPDRVFYSMQSLRLLNLHGNKIEFISQDIFDGVDVNLLANNQITHLTAGVFDGTKALEVLDLQGNAIERIDRAIFVNASFTNINLSKNKIKELSYQAFESLPFLSKLDLSRNELSSIKNGAFDRLSALKLLKLNNNKLTSFKGDFFTSRTQIENIDLSNNQISYLYPNSFTIHRRLRVVNLSHNKLSYFPSEILNSIRTLIRIDLSYNKLQSLENADFANIPRLRILNLKGNELNYMSSNVFHNSTQLQYLDLSENKLTSLTEMAFKGIARLNLNLSVNHFKQLPEEIFNRQYVFTLESIDLSSNNFTEFPALSLKKQYSSLERLNISRNAIQSLPANSDVLVNVKDLDLSHNPLNSDSHNILFGEPKSVRKLSVSNSRLVSLPTVIEAPFLKELNLSSNNISKIDANTFQKSTLLKSLDLSANKIPNMNVNVKGLWQKLNNLQYLYLSSNPIQYIMKNDLDDLHSLETLDLSSLPMLTHFECDSLSNLFSLKTLKLFGYKSLNYLEISECLSHINSKLEKLAIEVKEQFLKGHLQRAFSNRFNELVITGHRLTSLSSNCLTGIKSKELKVKVMDTSVNSIPPSLFTSIPMTTKLTVDIPSNEISSVNYQLLQSLDSKQLNVKLKGLEKNPIKCDCHLEPLWKWSHEKMKYNINAKYYNSIENLYNLTCLSPSHLYGHKLMDIELNELTCGEHTTKSTTVTSTPTTSTRRTSVAKDLFSKPDIILMASTRKPLTRGLNRNVDRRTTLTKVDTMIIGIVAGVIAFVCILILIICVVRLRSDSTSTNDSAYTHPLGCTCLKPAMQNACTNCYPTAFTGTIRASRAAPVPYYTNTIRPLPIKVIPSIASRRR
ncbi:chaoptin-like protein [Leptotrombidium deliense]|uniref:Chaoptin-like protein n=1 Tax=Leptotrombidium deliense TaxID=299467 RepID=A0A443SHK4_9ACAR|nr:chaoptin-like protein [Leptotrombidium deliense]